MPIVASQLDMAEQQLLGFYHAKQGFSLRDLVESMGLEKSEWKEMKVNGMVDYLDSTTREEIDSLFNL